VAGGGAGIGLAGRNDNGFDKLEHAMIAGLTVLGAGAGALTGTSSAGVAASEYSSIKRASRRVKATHLLFLFAILFFLIRPYPR